MTYQIGTQWQTLAPGVSPATNQTIRATHADQLVDDVHRLRATRLRSLWSEGHSRSTAISTFATLYDGQLIRTSPDSSDAVLVTIMGVRVEVRVTFDDGVSSTSVTVTQSGSSTTAATGMAVTAAPIASDADIRVTVEWRATSGTGTLRGVRIYEQNQTAANLS
jgi:hypothetical protein